MHICRSICLSLGFAAVSLFLTAPATAATIALSGPGDFGPSTVIDFEGHAEGTAANSLYASLGVTFSNNLPTDTTVPIIDWAALSRVTTSPDNVLATEDDHGDSVLTDFLDLIFSTTVTEVGMYFGNDSTTVPYQVTLEVFDAGDISLGSTTVLTNQNISVDQFIGLRSDPDPIVRARISYSIPAGTASVAIDDVIFNAVVPEPTTGLLLALGLVGLAARRSA